MVKDRTDGAGDEKVLSLPPSVFAAVALVPAFENAASDVAVSPFVETVGAADLDSFCGGPSCDSVNDVLLADDTVYLALCDSSGVEKDRCPLLFWCGNDSPRPEIGYGLFLEMLPFLGLDARGALDRFCETGELPSVFEVFRFASLFIQFENGLRRP